MVSNSIDALEAVAPPFTPSVSKESRAHAEERKVSLVVAADGSICKASESALPVLGYAPEELTGTLLFRHVYEQDMLSVFRGLVDLVLEREQEASLDFRMRTAKGLWHAFRAEARACLEGQSVSGVLLVLYPVITVLAS